MNHHQLIREGPNGTVWRDISHTPWVPTPPPSQPRETTERARTLNHQIKIGSMRLYSERLREWDRLRRLGVNAPKPRHYTETYYYRSATRRLNQPDTAQPRHASTPGQPIQTGMIRRVQGHIILIR